jgi:hypothetical protein
MRRRSRASSKPANARSRKAKTLKAARQHSSSPAGQETEVARLTRDLDEARELQAATGEVLRVISISPHDIQPVFDAIAENAARICQGQFAFVVLTRQSALLKETGSDALSRAPICNPFFDPRWHRFIEPPTPAVRSIRRAGSGEGRR